MPKRNAASTSSNPTRVSEEFNNLAIVTVENTNSVPTDLVRIHDLSPVERFNYRDHFLKTRRLFDSLCLFTTPEKSADLMRRVGLLLNRDVKVVGDLPGLCIGDVFMSDVEMYVLGLRDNDEIGFDNVMVGMGANDEPVAMSVIVDDTENSKSNNGDVIEYMGKKNRVKELEWGNLALERSEYHKIEVRVIRGLLFGCRKVYVYEGLYRVVKHWFDVDVFKFRFARVVNQVEAGSLVMSLATALKISPLEFRDCGYISLDLSKDKERVMVLVYNDVDDDANPLGYNYLVTSIFPPHVRGNGIGVGCECVNGCVDNCFCATRNGDGFAYDQDGTLVRGKPLVFECGPQCQCPQTCRNRVTQKGMKHRFEVFRTKEAGWGVRSLDFIPAGSFICEYAGIYLTQELAQILTMNGDNLVYSRRFAERWKEWGDLLQIFSDYVTPTSPSIPLLDFAIDVSRSRNVACYISHSLTPNVFVQPVLYDHNNVAFPHLMLFALENIPPMRELSHDYRVADEKLAICN